MDTQGCASKTQLQRLNGEFEKVALGYLRAAASKNEAADAQISNIVSVCTQNSKLMSLMTETLGKATDKDAQRERVTAQVQHTLANLKEKSYIAHRAGQDDYILTSSGWDHARSQDAGRKR